MVRVITALVMLYSCGCWHVSPLTADASEDSDGDTDADGDSGSDSDSDTDDDACSAGGNWYDSATGLCWQNPPSTDIFNWDDAATYCDGLSLAGHDDWRLPLIQELISLIRGCVDGTETYDLSTSACGVTDPDCLGAECCDSTCSACEWLLGGPDDDPVGCYWDPALAGECNSYWSSSSLANFVSDAWFVGFDFGYVVNNDKSHANFARCVRGGP